MANKLMGINVRGKHKSWGFHFYADPQYLEEWRADGLDINLLENVIPAWVVDWGLLRPWCFVQDCLNLKNPFRQ